MSSREGNLHIPAANISTRLLRRQQSFHPAPSHLGLNSCGTIRMFPLPLQPQLQFRLVAVGVLGRLARDVLPLQELCSTQKQSRATRGRRLSGTEQESQAARAALVFVPFATRKGRFVCHKERKVCPKHSRAWAPHSLPHHPNTSANCRDSRIICILPGTAHCYFCARTHRHK